MSERYFREPGPNTVTAEQFKTLKATFNGKLTPDEARETLKKASEDVDMPPVVKINIGMALLDLRQGRSVHSTMARLRRAVGLDPEKVKRED